MRAPSILFGLSRAKLADQLKCLGGRTFFNPAVFAAVPGPAHHAVIAEPPAQQGMVAKEVFALDQKVDLFFRQNLPGGQFRPDDPEAEFLLAVFRRPAHEPARRIEHPQHPFYANKIDRLGLVNRRAVFHQFSGGELRAVMLKIPVAVGPRQHVQDFEMARLGLAIGELALEGPSQGGNVIRMKGQKCFGHRLSLRSVPIRVG